MRERSARNREEYVDMLSSTYIVHYKQAAIEYIAHCSSVSLSDTVRRRHYFIFTFTMFLELSY
jgi:hypothetical protein